MRHSFTNIITAVFYSHSITRIRFIVYLVTPMYFVYLQILFRLLFFPYTKSQIAKFIGPAWGPPTSCWPQMGPMLAPWTLLSGMLLDRTFSRHVLGDRRLFIPGQGQHIIDDEGPALHVTPGDIITVENIQQDALETIPWFIMKRVICILIVDGLIWVGKNTMPR